jgi:hypothetical protein
MGEGPPQTVVTSVAGCEVVSFSAIVPEGPVGSDPEVLERSVAEVAGRTTDDVEQMRNESTYVVATVSPITTATQMMAVATIHRGARLPAGEVSADEPPATCAGLLRTATIVQTWRPTIPRSTRLARITRAVTGAP